MRAPTGPRKKKATNSPFSISSSYPCTSALTFRHRSRLTPTSKVECGWWASPITLNDRSKNIGASPPNKIPRNCDPNTSPRNLKNPIIQPINRVKKPTPDKNDSQSYDHSPAKKNEPPSKKFNHFRKSEKLQGGSELAPGMMPIFPYKTTLHLQHPIKSNQPYTYWEGAMATCPAPY